jgi:predicted metal-dependent RNase
MSKVKTNGVQEVIAVILQNIPSDAAVTKIEYEGPMIAIYTKNPRYLLENNVIISNIVKTIKKRIVVRTDESIRKSEEDARKIIMQLIPKDVGIVGTFFDTALGEVIIDVKKPWMLTQVDETKDEGMVGVGGVRVVVVEKSMVMLQMRQILPRMSLMHYKCTKHSYRSSYRCKHS